MVKGLKKERDISVQKVVKGKRPWGGIVHSRLLGTDSAPTLFNFSPTSLWTHPSPELLSDLVLLLVGGVRVMYNGTNLIGYQAGPLYLQAW